MTSGSPDPGSDSRARLGRRLRRARQAAGFTTMGPAATRLGVSVDLISKIETGKHVPPQDVFLALLDLYQVSEEARELLTDIWEVARSSRGKVPELVEKWFGNEAKALYLRLWALLFMPGLLQTREYAKAMFLSVGIDEDKATEETELRMGRQAILDSSDPVNIVAIIHEHALHTLVGSPEIMMAQLTHLVGLSHSPNVVIQVVRNIGYFIGMEGAFEVATGDAIPDTLLIAGIVDQASEDRMQTRETIAIFEKIRSHALSAEESRALIQEAIKRWSQQQ